jgi:hypothetical protein
MPYLILFFAGLLGLLTCKVPEGTNPFVFYMGSAAIAMVLCGAISLLIRNERPHVIIGIFGASGVISLLTMAIFIISQLPQP